MSATGVLADRYVVEELLGRGGMAAVYRARDRVLGRTVAVKLMRDVAASPTERARFGDEARLLARLSHPGLVTVLDAGTEQDRPYLVMELVDGPSLAECCEGVSLEPERVAAIGAQLAESLAYAHEVGIVHRDVKPGNVLLGGDDRVLLTDFGIARLMSETARHTATGVTVGTAAYLAPEQVRGEDVTAAADVYSLGLVLLEALTGRRAYQGAPAEAALARLTRPPQIPDSVPSTWHRLLRDMTATPPAVRPTAQQTGDRLRELASGLDPAAATAALRTASLQTGAPTDPMATTGERRPTDATVTFKQPRQPARRVLVRYQRWVLGAVLAALLLLLVITVSNGGEDSAGSAVPANVPARLEQPLQRLHDAVNGEAQ
jgi:eukaryotic-like serine/threonine-protein kinase